MPIYSAVTMFVVVWLIVLLLVLPVRLRTQGEEGDVVPGTHASAPANFHPARTVKLVTLITIVVWGILVAVISFGGITIKDLDWFHRMSSSATQPVPVSADAGQKKP